MPVWKKAVESRVEQGDLVVLGVAQEQHPDRCRLFAQWHRLGWPIVYDPINSLGLTGVPLEVALDQWGVVRAVRPDKERLEAEFLDVQFAAPAEPPNSPARTPELPDVASLRRDAERSPSAEAWRNLGDALTLWGGADRIGEAIEAYAQAVRLDPEDGAAEFRLGVAYRIRYDSGSSRAGDFQAAVEHWTRARQIDPNQYIWRRRVEQYGPRRMKPYPFYDWVDFAAEEIRARGEQPAVLAVAPTGSERARPDEPGPHDPAEQAPPDPDGRVRRDAEGLVLAEVTCVPPGAAAGRSTRVYVSLRPAPALQAHWNNEAEPLRFWVEPPPGWNLDQRLFIAPQGDGAESSERRRFEFDLAVPEGFSGTARLEAYALYYVCEDAGGTCVFLRLDIPIELQVNR